MRVLRLQLSRRKGSMLDPSAVKVDRSTKWGNPYSVEHNARGNAGAGGWGVYRDASMVGNWHDTKREAVADAIARFREALYTGTLSITLADVRRELRGKPLACWCALPAPGEPDLCHAAVLIEAANAQEAA